MKKIFAIISVLALSFVAAAKYYNYDPTEVMTFSISDDSYGNYYYYTIKIHQQGKNGSWYESDAYIYLYPKTHSFVGEFTLEDGTLDPYSFVQYGSAYRYFIEVGSYWETNNATKITISDNGDGTYTFGGTVICNYDSNDYRYLYSDYVFSVSEPDPFEAEPSEQRDITWTSDQLQVYSASGVTPVEMYAYRSDYTDIDLLFNVNSYDIPAGEYEISDSGKSGTVQAADGKEVNYMPNPSYIHDGSDIYYLRSGTLTVSYSGDTMTISGTATTAHGSTVTINLTGADPFVHAAEDPVIYVANEDGFSATVTGIDPAFTGDAVTIANTVVIDGTEYWVTAIADQAFTRKTGIRSIVLPENLWTIGKAAFSFCTGLERIECKTSAPPIADVTAFYKINPAIKVVVPSGSVDSYKAYNGWNMFTDITSE